MSQWKKKTKNNDTKYYKSTKNQINSVLPNGAHDESWKDREKMNRVIKKKGTEM